MAQHVLIVDDDVLARTLLKEALKSLGVPLAEAADGAAALLRIEAGDIAVVVVDLLMPKLSGLELVKHIQEKQLPIATVVVSGLDTPSLVDEARALGARGYLTKPFHPKEALAVVRGVWEGVTQ